MLGSWCAARGAVEPHEYPSREIHSRARVAAARANGSSRAEVDGDELLEVDESRASDAGAKRSTADVLAAGFSSLGTLLASLEPPRSASSAWATSNSRHNRSGRRLWAACARGAAPRPSPGGGGGGTRSVTRSAGWSRWVRAGPRRRPRPGPAQWCGAVRCGAVRCGGAARRSRWRRWRRPAVGRETRASVAVGGGRVTSAWPWLRCAPCSRSGEVGGARPRRALDVAQGAAAESFDQVIQVTEST
jgi:hypothetical protein